MLWRSDATWAILLRVSCQPTRRTHRVVVQIARNSSPALPPKDDGDHDPDIDLITLRRRHPCKFNMNNRFPESTDIIKPHRDHPQTDGGSFKPASLDIRNSRSVSYDPAQADSSITHRLNKCADIPADDLSSTSPAGPRTSAFAPGNESSRSYISSADTLDPYLVHYLKSLQSNCSKRPKPPISEPNSPSLQDRDLDSLRPVDLRLSYRQWKPKPGIARKDSQSSVTRGPSGEPGWIPDDLTSANIKALNIPSSGGKVVIPRPLLVRLIEETINLSGAAVRGEDVIIERYSPTWHRFARLLRTSDLHKISSLAQSKNSNPASRLESDVFGLGRTLQPSETVSEMIAQDPVRSDDVSSKASSPLPPVTEREYVVLTLDKKSRVVSNRFSRLLDGTSEIARVSTEDLLKVEHLSK
jgi:hypothetical protein